MLLFIVIVTDIPGFITEQVRFLQSLGGETLIRGIVVVLAFLLGLIAVGPERIEVFARWVASHWPGQSKDEQLRSRCRQLSAEIYQFMSDRDRDDRTHEMWYENTGAETEDEARKNWAREGIERDRHFTTTMSRYRERFEGRALALFDAAEQRGWIASGERFRFENPTNTHGFFV